MLCQSCQKNEADKVFVGNWMGRQFEWHVCDQCLHQIWRQASVSGNGDAFRAISGWWPGKEDPRSKGKSPFPQIADPAMKLRLQLNALKYRLEEAAGREDYEEAARLRDSIVKIEREEWSHEL